MEKHKMRIVATSALATVLVLGGIGYAYGEPAEDTSTPLALVGGAVARAGGGLAKVVADITGLDDSDVIDRRNDGESFADIATSEGVSTDEVKDAAVEDFESTLDERLSSTDALPERGSGGHGGRGGMSGGVSAESVLADLSDIDIDEIRTMRQDGQSLAQIAESEGVDIDTVIDTVIEKTTEQLQADVDEGRIDEDRKTEILEDLRTRLEEMVTSTDPMPLGGQGGPDGPPPAAMDGSTPSQ